MNEPSSISNENLERLIARALELEDEREQRLDLARAREIALELGVREDAWDAAVSEHLSVRYAMSQTMPPAMATISAPGSRWRGPLSAVVGGLAAGGIVGAVSAASSGDDIMIGSALVAVSAAYAVGQSLRRTGVESRRHIAIWWTSTAAGMLAGLGSFSAEILWFSAWAGLGCAGLAAAASTLARRVADHPSSHTASSTAR